MILSTTDSPDENRKIFDGKHKVSNFDINLNKWKKQGE
jgi:hypothetical protein